MLIVIQLYNKLDDCFLEEKRVVPIHEVEALNKKYSWLYRDHLTWLEAPAVKEERNIPWRLATYQEVR